MTALAGVFFAFYYNNLFPEQIFNFGRSIEIILGPVIGGLGTLFGPVLGAAVLTVLSETLNAALAALRHRRARRQAGALRRAARLPSTMFMPNGLWPPLARASACCGAAPCRSRRATAKAPMLEVEEVSKHFRGLKAVARASLRVERGRDRRAHRPERRRQDDALQPDRRASIGPTAARIRLRGHATRRPAPRPGLRGRHRPHLPDRQALRRPLGARQRDCRRLHGDARRRRARDAPALAARPRAARRSPKRACPPRSLTLPDRKRLEVARALATRP